MVSLLRLPLKTLVEDITGKESNCKDFPNNDSCNKTLLCYMFNNKNCKWKDHAYINVKKEEVITEINSRFNYLGTPHFFTRSEPDKIKSYVGDFIRKLIIIFVEEKQKEKQKYIKNYFTKKNVETQLKLLEILLYNKQGEEGHIQYELLKYPNKIPYPWSTNDNERKHQILQSHFSLERTNGETTDGVPTPLLYDTIDNISVLLKRLFKLYR